MWPVDGVYPENWVTVTTLIGISLGSGSDLTVRIVDPYSSNIIEEKLARKNEITWFDYNIET